MSRWQYSKSMSERPYHHGDLRRTILSAALEVVAAEGPIALSLRDLARRAGVSHAAPAHHFGDKAGLLTAIAVEGHALLGKALDEGAAGLAGLGVSYVRFAVEHPAHFEVMFRPDLYHRDAPEIVAAREASYRRLHQLAGTLPGDRGGADAHVTALAAWSAAHGFATLWRSDNLHRLTGGGGDAAAAFRTVAAVMFGGSPHGLADTG